MPLSTRSAFTGQAVSPVNCFHKDKFMNSRYRHLANFVFQVGDTNGKDSEHCFHSIPHGQLEHAEQRMGCAFPAQLRDFYQHIGCGFLCQSDVNFVDRIMDPESVADFTLREGRYKLSSYHEFLEEDELVFLELGDDCYLTMASSGDATEIRYYGEVVASDLTEFLGKMEDTANYFVELDG